MLRAGYGTITIGARTSVQDGTVAHTTEQWPTRIGAMYVENGRRYRRELRRLG